MSIDCCSRWSDPTIFQDADDVSNEIDEICNPEELKNSIAGFINETIANLHNDLMGSEYCPCIKVSCVLFLDAVLLSTAPIIALAEAILRFALAILTLPLFLFKPCSSSDWLDAGPFLALTSLYSLYQIPNTFITAYKTLTSETNIKAL